MWKFLNFVLFTSLLLSQCQSLYLPLKGRIPRCMIVYSVGESETVKLDINFPPLSDQLSHQYFLVSWKNTQTNEENTETIRNGRFRKELSLSQNVIYDLCVKTESSRDYGTAYVQYSAHNMFALNQAEIKIPEGLLKEEDITSSYLSAQQIEKTLDSFINVQNGKTVAHGDIFRKTDDITSMMIKISIAELFIIIGAAGFQFYAIWKYLKSKNYI